MSRGIAGVNDVLFRELDRLEAVDTDNPDAMNLEINRAKAIEGTVSKVIDNGKLVLDMCKSSVATGEAVKIPKALLGE